MPIHTQPLGTQTYHLLLREILSGKRKAGERISEESICDELGISRTPAREALMRLAADGLVERTARKGCRVLQIDLDKQRDLFECRAMMESLALDLAFKHIPPEPLQKILDDLLKAKSAQDASASLHADSLFHKLILTHCPNNTLVEFISRLMQQCNAFRALRAVSTDVTSITNERIEIVQAMLKKEKEKARSLLAAHIRQGIPK